MPALIPRAVTTPVRASSIQRQIDPAADDDQSHADRADGHDHGL